MQFLEGAYHYTKIFRALCFHVTDGVVVAVVASRRVGLICWQFAGSFHVTDGVVVAAASCRVAFCKT